MRPDLRAAEAASIKVANIDSSRVVIRVKRGTTARVVPLLEAVPA
jgi:integrase